MSTVVLARKYRSKNFTEMVGQPHVVRALSNALASQRLHHAYLFTGTRGVGKTTVSRILAKALNCTGEDGQGGITAEPCGKCNSCRDIDAGRFVDYTELDAASNRGVDEIESLLEQAVYKPVVGRFKVFMIDEVHMLTNHAFNAMLKTLEEPPDYLKFVLATTDPQKVPVTVLSRCLLFNLRPMAPETITEHLALVLDSEGVPHDAAALELIARGARGSMRDALSLTDQAIAFGGGALAGDAVRQMLGAVDRTHVLALLAALVARDGAQVFALCEALRAHGFNAASTLEDMVTALQRITVLHMSAAPGSAADAELAALAAQIAPDETQLLYSLCLHGQHELSLSPEEYAGLAMVLVRFLAFAPGVAPNVAPAPQESGGAVAAEKKPEATPPQAPATAARPPALMAGPGSIALDAPSAPRLAVRDLMKPAPKVPLADDALQPAAPPQPTNPVLAPAPIAAVVAVSMPAWAPEPARAPRRPGNWVQDERPAIEAWHGIVADLIARDLIAAVVKEFALNTELVEQTETHWTLRCDKETLLQGSAKERLQTALSQLPQVAQIGAPQLELVLSAAPDTPAARAAQFAAAKLQAAQEAFANDAELQGLMKAFGGTIVAGSIKPLA